MSDFLGIDLIAGLNRETSRQKINQTIKQLNSSGLDKIRADIDINPKVLQTIRQFNQEMRKLSQQADRTGQSIRRATMVQGDGKASSGITKTRQEIERLTQAQKRQVDNAVQANNLEARSIQRKTKETEKFDDANKRTQRKVDYSDRDGVQKSSKTFDGDGNTVGSQTVYDYNKENKMLQQVANERQRLTDRINKIRATGYGNEKQLQLFESQTATRDMNVLKSLGREVDAYGKTVQNIPKTDRIQNTINSLKRMEQYGSITLPKKNMLSEMETQLKNATTPKEINRITNELSKLQSTAAIRAKGVSVIEDLRKESVLGYEEMKKITQARADLQRATTPERAQGAMNVVNDLKKQNDGIKASNRELTTVAKQREELMRRVSGIGTNFGDLANKDTLSMFSKNIVDADKQQLDRIGKNVSEYQGHMQKMRKINNAQRGFQDKVYSLDSQLSGSMSADSQKKLAGIGAEFNKLTPQTKNLDGEINKLNSRFRQFSIDTMKADQGVARFSRQLASAMVRVPIYAATMAAMYAPLRMFQDAISQTIEIDSQMTVLERVSDGAIEMNDALSSSIEIAKNLGNEIREVNDGMINFARQGFRDEDLATMTEYATVMSNISDLNAEESASSLTAAMKGFNIEAEDSLHIVDAMNEVNVNQPPCTVMYM